VLIRFSDPYQRKHYGTAIPHLYRRVLTRSVSPPEKAFGCELRDDVTMACTAVCG
jgi:hypothetical protein